MKKINKVAAQDAVRYIQAKKTLNEINQRAWQDVKYADAVDAAVNRIESNATSRVLAEQSSSRVVRNLKVGALIGIGVIVLHETGYDAVIWDKVKRWSKRTQQQAAERAEELKEQFPETAEKAANVKDAAVHTAKETTNAAQTFVQEAQERFDKGEGGPHGDDVKRPTQGPYGGSTQWGGSPA